jgi:hypothetical protein
MLKDMGPLKGYCVGGQLVITDGKIEKEQGWCDMNNLWLQNSAINHH